MKRERPAFTDTQKLANYRKLVWLYFVMGFIAGLLFAYFIWRGYNAHVTIEPFNDARLNAR